MRSSIVILGTDTAKEAAAAEGQLKKLDDSLRLATFLAGAAPTIADLFVYSAIFPVMVTKSIPPVAALTVHVL